MVGTPVGVRNFLSVTLASARSRLGPTETQKNAQKKVKTQEKALYSRCYVHLEWFGLTCGSASQATASQAQTQA